MKIVLFGASGQIGRRILKEAVSRGYDVTAVSRDPGKIPSSGKQVRAVKGDAADPSAVAALAAGADAVVNATNFIHNPEGTAVFTKIARAMLDGTKRAKVKRLIIVGGAGSLEVAPGHQLVDTPEFPPAYKEAALAHRDAFKIYKTEQELEWTYVSPAAIIEPGQRTGAFRLGEDRLLVDAAGNSKISMEDFAVALCDELEKREHLRRRFTVAY